MSTPERRLTSRTTMERLAYINIEPNNGGIVLNVSDEGLCFHSIAPVVPNGRFRFSLLEQHRRIDACGELAWTDEIQKIGGVRFTTLTTDAREQIHDWLSQPGAPVEKTSTLGAAILKAFPKFRILRAGTNAGSATDAPANSSVLSAALLKARARVRIKLTGFSGGLATGLLISALWASVFLLSAHRRDIGVSLIHLGARLAGDRVAGERATGGLTGARPEANLDSGKQAPFTTPRVVSPANTSVAPVRVQTPARPPVPAPSQIPVHAQIPAERHKNPPEQPLPSPGKTQPATSNNRSAALVVTPRGGDGSTPPHPTSHATAMAQPTPPAVPLGATSALAANVTPGNLGPPPRVETANVGPVRDSEAALLPQMYFELGKSKDELWARNLSDKVAELGIRASVIQRGHLWMNSYHVLAGPYSEAEEATKTHKTLLSHGYKPRPFERGSRSFIFGSALTLNGSQLPVGDFTISWESYVTDAKVKFEQGNGIVATADGRWIQRPRRYEHNEIVYQRNGNGSRILLEIHFSGQDRALVFRDAG